MNTMNKRGRRKRAVKRLAPLPRLVQMAAPLLLALLVAACSAGADPSLPARVSPTSTPPPVAENQDLVAAPAVPVATPTAGRSLTPARGHQSLPTGVPVPPSISGHVILVSLERQQLYAYENGVYAFTIPVETGRPELPTPTGVYSIYLKSCSDLRWQSNSAPTSAHNAYCEHSGDGYQELFRSPWPEGSPNWYAPTHINYALAFRDGGFFLHDAWWHVKFGPGGNVPHQLPNGVWETGSHGCVGMTTAAAEKLYLWAPIGTAVYIRQGV